MKKLLVVLCVFVAFVEGAAKAPEVAHFVGHVAHAAKLANK